MQTGWKWGVWKERKERRRRDLRVQTVWEPSPISKKQEVERNVTEASKMGKTEKKPSENTQTTRMPLKNFASLRQLNLHCTCFLHCCFVVVIAIPSQMLLFIQWGLVKMSLFYHGTMFHCDTLPRRQNVAMCTATSKERQWMHQCEKHFHDTHGPQCCLFALSANPLSAAFDSLIGH